MTLAAKLTRLAFLSRRVSRIGPAEIPFRVRGVMRRALQQRGFRDARSCPAWVDLPKFGKAWIRVPDLTSQARASIAQSADALLAKGVTIFDLVVPIGAAQLDWNRDPKSGKAIALRFGLAIDFRHLDHDIDIKYLWELNRHLWWVEIAQAYAVSGEARYLRVLGELLDSWLRACPYALGPNWSSPVEQGIRLINWSLVWHLIGGEHSPLFEGVAGQALLQRWTSSVYQHMRFASDNYSLHSSSNNHLLGELAGVYVASQTWDLWARGRALGRAAKSLLEAEALKQFAADGVNLEQSSNYQRFALQFLWAAGLAGQANADPFSRSYWDRIDAATSFMAAVMDCAGHLPNLGDSDDGEVFRLACACTFSSDLALLGLGAAWLQRGALRAKLLSIDASAEQLWPWFMDGPPPVASDTALQSLPTAFPEGGYMLLGERLHTRDELRVLFDCGPLGYNKIVGHGHADALSVLLSWAGEPLLVDSGTYCYNSADEWRRYFRGTSAHNTLRVDRVDQSVWGASFLWLTDVNTDIIAHEDLRSVHARHDGYARLKDAARHHRRVRFDAQARVLWIEDWLECRQAHEVELFWHGAAHCTLVREETAEERWILSGPSRAIRLSIEGVACQACAVRAAETPPQGWVSPGFYRKTAASVLLVSARLEPRQLLRTRIDLLDGGGVSA